MGTRQQSNPEPPCYYAKHCTNTTYILYSLPGQYFWSTYLDFHSMYSPSGWGEMHYGIPSCQAPSDTYLIKWEEQEHFKKNWSVLGSLQTYSWNRTWGENWWGFTRAWEPKHREVQTLRNGRGSQVTHTHTHTSSILVDWLTFGNLLITGGNWGRIFIFFLH